MFGHSRENLQAENMPSHEDIMDFSNKIAPLTGKKGSLRFKT